MAKEGKTDLLKRTYLADEGKKLKYYHKMVNETELLTS